MNLRTLVLVSCVLLGCRGWSVELPQGVHFADDGSFHVGQTQVGVRIVPSSGWRNQFRNAAFKVMRHVNTSTRRTLAAEIPVPGGVAEQEIVAQADGSTSVDFFISFTNKVALTAAFFEIRLPSQLKSMEIDGKALDFPETSNRAGLGTFKLVCSFSVMALDGVRTMFKGPFPMAVQDSRVFGENWFEIRIPLQRKGEQTTELSRSFSFICERTNQNGVDFFRWGKGLPVYRNPVFHEGPEWVKVDFARTTSRVHLLTSLFCRMLQPGNMDFWCVARMDTEPSRGSRVRVRGSMAAISPGTPRFLRRTNVPA